MSGGIWAGRIAFLLVYIVVQALLLLYAGLGYAVLLGYMALITVLAIPAREEWLGSGLGRAVYGGTNPEVISFVRSLNVSRGYRLTVIVAAVVLLAVAMLLVLFFNYTLPALVTGGGG